MRPRSVLAPLALAALMLCPLGFTSPARADLLIAVDKSGQQMTVTVDGNPLYVWRVSTGMSGYDTPSGEFKPFRMEAEHFSREWDDAPMPHSIFFTQQGHAIHGSNHVKAIGTPASHGCVRLEPKNAGTLFALVKQQKMANTRVVLVGETPVKAGTPMARRNQGDILADEDFTGALPAKRQRQTRNWREDPYGQQSFFDRARPYYYEQPRRTYRYGGGPLPYRW
jgi:L,D-transpeptidase catalytic domain